MRYKCKSYEKTDAEAQDPVVCQPILSVGIFLSEFSLASNCFGGLPFENCKISQWGYFMLLA